jgi:hypothetical protein
MRRLLVLSIVTALVAPLAIADAAPAGGQTAEGTVALAGPGPNGETTGGCWTGWARRAWIVSGGATAGPFGSIFEIDKKTWGGPFELEVVGGAAGTEDLDVTFYADPGKIDPADPAMQAGIIETGAYLTRTAGGEDGTVPPTSTIALVCLGIGTGANAEWTYEAKPLPKKKKRK